MKRGTAAEADNQGQPSLLVSSWDMFSHQDHKVRAGSGLERTAAPSNRDK